MELDDGPDFDDLGYGLPDDYWDEQRVRERFRRGLELRLVQEPPTVPIYTWMCDACAASVEEPDEGCWCRDEDAIPVLPRYPGEILQFLALSMVVAEERLRPHRDELDLDDIIDAVTAFRDTLVAYSLTWGDRINANGSDRSQDPPVWEPAEEPFD